MKYKAVCFDADGVLIKSKHLFSEQLVRDFGMDMQKMLPFFKGIFRECGIGKADLKEELRKVVGEWGWKGTVDELIAYWFSRGTQIDHDTVLFIQSLKNSGIYVCMTSAQEKYRGEHLRNILSEMFDEFFYSAETGYRKNTLEFWENVYRKIEPNGAQRHEVLVIDDDKENLDFAKKCGLDTFLYNDNLNTLGVLLHESKII